MILTLLLSIHILDSVRCQISFHHAPAPPSHPFGAAHFPRFTKCGATVDGADEVEWWQREYGCANLFASIGALGRMTHARPTGTTQPPTSSVEPLPDMTTPKKTTPDGHSSKHGSDQQARRRAHRAGGLGVGPVLGLMDLSAWHQRQYDALEDMTAERRKKDAQTCPEFRVLAAKVVSWAPLEKICCNVMCYCADLLNGTNQDKCGPLESTSGPPGTTQRPKTGKNPPGDVTGSEGTNSSPTASSKTSRVPTSTGAPHTRKSTMEQGQMTEVTVLTEPPVTEQSVALVKPGRPMWSPISGTLDNPRRSSPYVPDRRFNTPEEWGNILFGQRN